MLAGSVRPLTQMVPLATMPKSPLVVRLVKVAGEVPTLVMVTVCEADVTPVKVEAKVAGEGENVNKGPLTTAVDKPLPQPARASDAALRSRSEALTRRLNIAGTTSGKGLR